MHHGKGRSDEGDKKPPHQDPGGRIRTGGELNRINERFRINSRRKSVPIMPLLSHHRVHTPSEVEALIAAHVVTQGEECCSCKIVSQGTVVDFGTNLFEACKRINSNHTLEQCIDFQRQLFTVAPLRGRVYESRSRIVLSDRIGGSFTTRSPTEHEEFQLAVDYVVMDGTRPVCGIQVKPSSFFYKKRCVAIQNEKHKKSPFPVFYHTYVARQQKFKNTEEMVENVEALLKKRTNDDLPSSFKQSFTTIPWIS